MVNVNGLAAVSEWFNDGVVTVNSGGTLNNSVTDLVSGGGSRIYVNPGGAIHADSSGDNVAIDLNGGHS